ncbi:MAG: tetratricopeptide repeat protein [Subdoligranulum variabile]|nr:tetratricopeptide repeat protein [Subdoligranulum variabile]
MSTEKRKNLLLFAAVTLLAILLFAACGSKAATAADKIELGQKYLIELNYTEAIASFTEAIKLDPNNIQAYMGRAEAYLALGEYDKALEDYQFVCEKTEEMPYTRALSYIGQAEVYGKTDEPEKAVSDYELSKALLSASDVGKAENVSEEDVEAKMVQVLYAHAALCEILKNYNTALEDYNDLLKLGEKVDSKRGEILSQLGESIEEENGLLGTEADKVASEPNTEEPIEEKLTEEPAAEQKTSSASESQPTSEETKPEEPASSSKQSQEEAASLQEEITEINWVEETVKSKYCSNSVSVRYSIGAKSIQLLYDGEPKTYHLSAPLQSVQRVKKGDYEHFVFYVPEGTTVTADWSGVDGAMLRWIEVSHIFSEDELQNVNDSDVQMETSMTVRKNIMYQQVQEWDYVTHFSWVSDDGGIIFCAE